MDGNDNPIAITGMGFQSGTVGDALPGDANLDGKVDINDLTIVLAHYNQTGRRWTTGEFTGSGTVDINDLTIVLAHYNQTLGSSGPSLASVPEPSALLLVLAGLLLLPIWCRADSGPSFRGRLDHGSQGRTFRMGSGGRLWLSSAGVASGPSRSSTTACTWSRRTSMCAFRSSGPGFLSLAVDGLGEGKAGSECPAPAGGDDALPRDLRPAGRHGCGSNIAAGARRPRTARMAI